VAIALALFAERLRREAPAWRRALVLGVLAFCAVEQLHRPLSYDKAPLQAEVATLAAAIPMGCRAFFHAPVRGPRSFEESQLNAMWASLLTGIPTVNGYSSNSPKGWELFEHNVWDEADDGAVLRTKLGAWESSHGLPPGTVCWVPVLSSSPRPEDARFGALTLPDTVFALERFGAQVEFINTGQTVWERGGWIRPRLIGAPGWKLLKADLPSPVGPGQTARFELQLQAPASPGTSELRLQMVFEGVGVFGQPSPRTKVLVGPSGAVTRSF
jgi:hypothetical protein